MKDGDKLKKKIAADDDFIYCPRLGNSMARLLEKNPLGVNDDRIKKVLLMDDEEFEETYKSALNKLRSALNVGEDNA